jgi:hypothetical protein
MGQRIYWVPHTLCFLGCEHCHNDSRLSGARASTETIDRIVARLPGLESPYHLDEVLVGGGEALMRGAHMEHLIRAFRRRFPRGPQATVAGRRATGHPILALQTMGLPLADALGNPVPGLIDYWLELGVDYFQVASNDLFHEQRRPDYPWQALRDNLARVQAERGVEFLIYGKGSNRLVPSGRVLDNLPSLRRQGASLLTEEGYCATAWEAACNFLSGTHKQEREASEVVIDPDGWVHPCCWHELSPGLFDLTATDFEAGMQALREQPLCQALDRGDVLGMAELAGLDRAQARSMQAAVGECGLCRVCAAGLARQPTNSWLRVPPLSDRERSFYAESGVRLLEPQEVDR